MSPRNTHQSFVVRTRLPTSVLVVHPPRVVTGHVWMFKEELLLWTAVCTYCYLDFYYFWCNWTLNLNLCKLVCISWIMKTQLSLILQLVCNRGRLFWIPVKQVYWRQPVHVIHLWQLSCFWLLITEEGRIDKLAHTMKWTPAKIHFSFAAPNFILDESHYYKCMQVDKTKMSPQAQHVV